MNTKVFREQKSFLSEKLEGKTIMVSGATGLVGSAIVRYLIRLNDEFHSNIKIIPLIRDNKKYEDLFSSYGNRQDVVPRPFSIENDISFDDNVNAIIHCAGISGGSKMHLKDPIKIYDIGIIGTRKLLDYAISHCCERFVYVSTYEIYGGINDDSLISETHACMLDPLLLRNSYAEVKRLCESLCVAYAAKYGVNVFCGRLTSTFGIGVDYNDPRFFAEFARCVANGRNIVMKSTGGTIRNYLDVDDAASAFLYILINGENGQAYNVTNRLNAISVREIAERIIEIGGNKVELVFDVAEDVKALGYRKEGVTLMNPSKLERLGWSPVYSFDETLRKLLGTIKNQL